MFGDDFLDMLNSVITIEIYTGADPDFNDPTYDTLRYYRAYLNSVGELFVNQAGQQIVSSVTAYIHPLEVNSDGSPKTGGARLTSIHDLSRVGFPDPLGPGGYVHPRIQKVNGIADETAIVQLFQVHT